MPLQLLVLSFSKIIEAALFFVTIRLRLLSNQGFELEDLITFIGKCIPHHHFLKSNPHLFDQRHLYDNGGEEILTFNCKIKKKVPQSFHA